MDTSDSHDNFYQEFKRRLERLERILEYRPTCAIHNESAEFYIQRLNWTMGDRQTLHDLNRLHINSEQNLSLLSFVELETDDGGSILIDQSVQVHGDMRQRNLTVRQMDKDLKRRKQQHESIHGVRKTLRELCKKYPVFVTEYLHTCISLHSSEPVRGFSDENLFQLVNSTLKNAEILEKLRTIRTSTKNNLLKIEIPLNAYIYRVRRCVLRENSVVPYSKVAIDEEPFIPSTTDPFLKSLTSEMELILIPHYHRWSVVLGDPGSGKTTCLRSLTKAYAETLIQWEEWIMKEENGEADKQVQIFDRLRLPILIRVDELSTWLDSNPLATVLDYIGQHTWFGHAYVASENAGIVREFIHHGNALVLFDGLDELSDNRQRQKVVEFIQRFINENIRSSKFFCVDDNELTIDDGGFSEKTAQDYNGNQVIVTSRIIGYYLFPLRGQQFSSFILQPMNQTEFQSFLDHWLTKIHENLLQWVNSIDQIDNLLDKEKLEMVRTEKENKVKEMFDYAGEKVWSHPMLFALALPIFYNETYHIKATQRMALYETIVKGVLNTLLSLPTSLLNYEALEWILCDIAVYLHNNCPSGVIDEFDLTRLSELSLRSFYMRENTSDAKVLLKVQATEFVSLLNSNIVFVGARGLNAYGFIHRMFQEYFVALTLVQPRTDKTMYISPSFMADRFITYIIKPNYYEPLALAIQWLRWKWTTTDFDTFLTILMDKYVGSLPIGLLFLITQLEELSRPLQLAVFDRLLLFMKYDKLFLSCLQQSFSKMSLPSDLIMELLQQSIHVKLFCRLVFHSIYFDWKEWKLPHWLPIAILWTVETTNEIEKDLETLVDFALRKIFSTDKPIDTYSKDILTDMFLKTNMTADYMHPLFFSVIVALCGDFRLATYSSTIKIQFSPKTLRRSTPLADVLISYFSYMRVAADPLAGILFLIQQCEEIILNASTNDVSQRVVDAFVALICMRGVEQLGPYRYLKNYKAFPRALYRLKLNLYHMRCSYLSVVEQLSALNGEKHLSIEYSNTIFEKILHFETNSKNPESLVVAIAAAHTRLTTPLIRNVAPISLPFSFQNIECYSSQFLRLIGDLCIRDKQENIEKWSAENHIYTLLQEQPFFLVSFVPEHLQPLFERLILTNRLSHDTNTYSIETLPFAVLLNEVFFSVYDNLTVASPRGTSLLRSVLLLFVLNQQIEKYNMDSALIALLQIAKEKMSSFFVPEFLSDFVHVKINSSIENELEKEQHRMLDILNQFDQRKIDLRMFSSSITFAYLSVLMTNKNELFEDAEKAAKNIHHPILRMLSFQHLLRFARRWLEMSHFEEVLQLLSHEIKKFPDDLPSLFVAFVLLPFVRARGHVDKSIEHLWKSIPLSFLRIPKDESGIRDQETVFRAVEFIWHRSMQCFPLPFIWRTDLPDILRMNSLVFTQYFRSQASLDCAHAVPLISQMYLAELAVDAQKLVGLAELSNASESPSLKEQFKRLWKSVRDIFPHHVVTFVWENLFSQFIGEIEVPFEDLKFCFDFEKQDRLLIEKWLELYDDHCRCQFALLAVYLFVRSEKKMTSAIQKIVENILEKSLFSTTDKIRRSARACFIRSSDSNDHIPYRSWSQSLWSLLQKLYVTSLDGNLQTFKISSADDMESLLELEQQRVEVSMKNEQFSHVSFFQMISLFSDTTISFYEARIRTLLMDPIPFSDQYIATTLIHLVRTFDVHQWEQKKSFFSFLEFLYDSNLPLTQQAVVYAWNLHGHQHDDTLTKIILFHCDASSIETVPFSNGTKLMTDDVLIACLWSLTQDVSKEYRSDPNLDRCLWNLWKNASKSKKVRSYAAACYLSRVIADSDTFDQMQVRLEVNVHDLYSYFMINTSYLFDLSKRKQWFNKTIELIYEFLPLLIDQFVSDLNTFLSVNSQVKEFVEPRPCFLQIAHWLVLNKQSKVLYRTIGMSAFGQKKFLAALYQMSKKYSADQRSLCITLYESIREDTPDFIDMVFTACLDDFTPIQSNILWHTRFIEHRDHIETLIWYTKSPSMIQRYLAARWLVKLALLQTLSSVEVCQLLEGVLNDPLSKQILYVPKNKSDQSLDEYLRSLLLQLTCLSPLEDKKSIPVLTLDEVEADYDVTMEEVPIYMPFSIFLNQNVNKIDSDTDSQ